MGNAARNLLDDGIPFHDLIGLEITEIGEGYVEAYLEMSTSLSSREDQLVAHGGILTVLVDAAGGLAMCSLHDLPTPTIDLRTDFLQPATGDLYAEGRVVRAGESVGISDVLITDETGTDVAVGRGRFKTRGEPVSSAWLTSDDTERFRAEREG